MQSEPKRFWIGTFAIQSARGIIRDRSMRRRTMSVIVAAALVMVLAGSTILHSLLDAREHPGWVMLYWLVCAWLTICALLIAVFDLLLVRAEGRAARKLLREQISRRATKS